jgi:pantothenate synthetase
MRALSGEVLLAVAARVGAVRLIDNQLVDAP